MEKKIPIKDIYPLIGKNIKDTYVELERILGNKNPFASIGIGQGYLLWKDTRRNWQQMIAASDIEQEAIRATKYELKKELIPLLGEDNAEKLFTTPDDSYIYYDYDGQDIKILITGWGYEKPVQHNVRPDIEDITKPNPVTIAFVRDGERLANYQFGIQLPKQVKGLWTAPDGMYGFSNLKSGSQCTLVDIKSGKRFTLRVVPGQSHYDFDITTYCQLRIKATADMMPCVGENVYVSYNNKSFEAVTDTLGEATLSLPYVEAGLIRATLREQTQTKVVSMQGAEIIFAFESEKSVEEPEVVPPVEAGVETNIEVIVLENSNPKVGRKVVINYGGNTIEGETNDFGLFAHRVTIIPDASCRVSVDGYDVQEHILAETPSNIFTFDKEIVEGDHHLLVKRKNGEVEGAYPVIVDYNNQTMRFTSDDNGIVILPTMEQGASFAVTNGNNNENISTYTFDTQQLEYIFYIEEEEIKDIKLTFLDYYERPIRCQSVSLEQKDTMTELEATLDEDASMTFPETTFAKNQEIAVNINGAEREFRAILFTIDEGEYEYVLQEEKPKLLWGVVLLQVAVLLAMIALLGLVWYLFEPSARELFNFIYN